MVKGKMGFYVSMGLLVAIQKSFDKRNFSGMKSYRKKGISDMKKGMLGMKMNGIL
jgi:hypothetical protein